MVVIIDKKEDAWTATVALPHVSIERQNDVSSRFAF